MRARTIDPIATTYVKVSNREPSVHVRIYSPRHDVDLRGSGSTIEHALASVHSKLLPRRSSPGRTK